MRRINKQPAIASFTDFVRRQNPIVWDDCDRVVKKETREFILLEEQLLLCGYTEIYINDEDYHIDHYVKRDIDNNLCYDWNNLIVAVNESDFGAKYKDGSKGVKVKDDYNKIFNPINDNTQDLFRYTTDGKIHPAKNISPANNIKAQKTIEIFNLVHPSLTKRRHDLATNIYNLKQGGINNDDVTIALEEQGFKSFIAYILDNYYK